MSLHVRLSEAWTHLQGRHDIAGILREIIGQHSIDSAFSDDDNIDSASSIQAVIWIKTIFDLQRCYLSGVSNGVADLPPYVVSYLLPLELLLSSILYLVHVKTRLFPSGTTLITKEFTRPRQILAQTILSGLRLLLLRKEGVAAQDKRRLQKVINQAWQNDRLQAVERFIVSDLFAQILDSIIVQEAARDRVDSAYLNEWRQARLPTFGSGLYPLDIRPETFMVPLIQGTTEEDWIDAYWVLFDCLWAAESAIIQRYVDIGRQTESSPSASSSPETDELLEQLYHTRTSLIVSIFHIIGPMPPPPALLDSLALTLVEWNDDLGSFLSRQDSLLHQSTGRPTVSRTSNYGRHVSELVPYFESALTSFARFLAARNKSTPSSVPPQMTGEALGKSVNEWITRMTSPNAETLRSDLSGSILPVYIVDCPKLHVVPKRFLEYKLRWCDKWAYESVQENSPIVNWKEGIPCPSCNSGEKIKFARLIEPFQRLSRPLESAFPDGISHYSIGESGSYDATSASQYSREEFEVGASSSSNSMPSRPAMTGSLPSDMSRVSPPSEDLGSSRRPISQLPEYSESPISPVTSPMAMFRTTSQASLHPEYPVSPLNESLNVPIPMASRFSMQLPIPLTSESVFEGFNTPSDSLSASAPSELASNRAETPTTELPLSTSSFGKQKSTSRTVRIANSIRRRPSAKEKDTSPLPKDPSFLFSASGHSLFLWGKGGKHVMRFDIPSNDTTAIQGCKYEVAEIEAVAAGHHKCAVVTSSLRLRHRLVVFDGLDVSPCCGVDLDFSGRITDICLAVARNDRYIALSINDQIHIFRLDTSIIKPVPFHHQIHVYELRGGTSHKRTIPIGRRPTSDSLPDSQKTDTGWFGGHTRELSYKEAAEEQKRASAIVSRKLYFSPNSERLAVATQLGDHCIYVDVWDCTHEPVSTISEHSRSFPMPPWTLNDGDLTAVFYDDVRRCALVTAFLGKEYPLLIPFPGYETLQNETYSTKIVHAAQSPSGDTFIVANAMTEVIQFEYNSKGSLSPRKLKKSSQKISSGVFKPGGIRMAMPEENCLRVFWIRDQRLMLRVVRLGSTESWREVDLRSWFDRLMGLRGGAVIRRAPSLCIPEMEGS
ncbi:hypothetical protein M011DRAFT_528351 [Sporormia fimetaria CBS 119925]|uniref:WD40 repeat-like protein n=1 Tax=Sporormia fimetaria CBS 119925 TaxID=1340428 RepID=A0A6A6V4A2_9PLEO|nr:hypothetical protein M011DRAFT_528351 [Sporormia fimetaria CBS 119925]